MSAGNGWMFNPTWLRGKARRKMKRDYKSFETVWLSLPSRRRVTRAKETKVLALGMIGSVPRLGWYANFFKVGSRFLRIGAEKDSRYHSGLYRYFNWIDYRYLPESIRAKIEHREADPQLVEHDENYVITGNEWNGGKENVYGPII